MTIPFIACQMFDFDLVFKVTGIVEFFKISNIQSWHKRSSLGLEDLYHKCRHIYLKNYPTYINQISLISVKVTAVIDIFNENQRHTP